MNEKYFGELARAVDSIVEEAALLENEINKCAYTAIDLPISAIRRRAQRHLSAIEKLISIAHKAIDQG